MLLLTFFSLFYSKILSSKRLIAHLLSNKLIFLVIKKRRKYHSERIRFVAGDSIKKSEIEKRLDLTRRKLINTNLFISVELKSVQVSDNQINIDIKLMEQWYIFRIPHISNRG